VRKKMTTENKTENKEKSKIEQEIKRLGDKLK
jgi:hypothetical protein